MKKNVGAFERKPKLILGINDLLFCGTVMIFLLILHSFLLEIWKVFHHGVNTLLPLHCGRFLAHARICSEVEIDDVHFVRALRG